MSLTKGEFAVLVAKIAFEALESVFDRGASTDQGLQQIASAALAGVPAASAEDAAVDARIDAERAKDEA